MIIPKCSCRKAKREMNTVKLVFSLENFGIAKELMGTFSFGVYKGWTGIQIIQPSRR